MNLKLNMPKLGETRILYAFRAVRDREFGRVVRCPPSPERHQLSSLESGMFNALCENPRVYVQLLSVCFAGGFMFLLRLVVLAAIGDDSDMF